MSEQPSDTRTRADRVAQAIPVWQRELAALGGPNALLWHRDGPLTLDLTRAHPGGVARFLSGARTRLSDLFREPSAYAEARRTGHAIREHAGRLDDDHGLVTAFLGVGMATWSVPDGQRSPGAPVLLRRVVLTPVRHDDHTVDLAAPTDGHADLALDLGPSVEVNTVLLEFLRTAHGITLDAAAIERRALAGGVVDAGPAYAELDRACGAVPGWAVTQRQIISTFPHAKMAAVTDLVAQRSLLLTSEPIAAAAGDPAVASTAAAAIPAWTDNPDPAQEVLVLDADADQSAAIDAARHGASLVISARPGTGATQTVANLVAALAAAGRRTLLLAEPRRELTDVVERLATVGLGDLVLHVRDEGIDRSAPVAQLALTLEQRRLDRTIAEPTGPDGSPRPAGRRLFGRTSTTDRGPHPAGAPAGADPSGVDLDTLRAARGRLLDHVATMHQPREPWGVSAYQIERAVAALAARPDPPTSRVRLDATTLATLRRDDLAGLAEQLATAARAGEWASAEPNPWYGATVATTAEVERAQAIIERLVHGDLERAAVAIEDVIAEAHLPAGTCVDDWRRSVAALRGVQQTLEVFRPEIFAEDLSEQIEAADDSSSMSWATRTRVRRQTRSLLRPGPPPADLRGSLMAAHEQRATWRSLVGPGARPRPSTRVDHATSALASVAPDLEWLTTVLSTTPAAPDLATVPFDDLTELLRWLAATPEQLAVLPEVVGTVTALRAAGLGDLVADLASRGVDPQRIPVEVEHVWWSSLAGYVAGVDRAYGGHDGASLHATLRAYRDADRAHIGAGAARVRRAVAEHALRADAPVVAVSSGAFASPRAPAEVLSAAGPGLLSIAPVWAMSPLTVATVLPPGRWFDCVVVLGAHATTAARCVAGLSRADHVVAVADPSAPPPLGFAVSSTATPPEQQGSAAISLAAALSALPHRRLGTAYGLGDAALLDVLPRSWRTPDLVTFPRPGSEAVVRFVRVDGTAYVVPGPEAVIESTDAEVAEVVDRVRDHLRDHADRSVAVIALNRSHAERVTAALATAGLLGRRCGGEPVVVSPARECAGLRRDTVIVTVGYGRTMHGRVIHRFPDLAGQAGELAIVAALTRAREHLVVVSSLTGPDLDPERLTTPGSALLREVLVAVGESVSQAAEGQPGQPDGLLDDLARRLAEAGLSVVAQRCAGRPALRVQADDVPGAQPVRVEGDDPMYAARRCVRGRDRLHAEALERRGWRPVQVWATDLFRDPARDVSRVLAAARTVIPPAPSELVHMVGPDGGADRTSGPCDPTDQPGETSTVLDGESAPGDRREPDVAHGTGPVR